MNKDKVLTILTNIGTSFTRLAFALLDAEDVEDIKKKI